MTRLAAFHTQFDTRMQFQQKFGRLLCKQTVHNYAQKLKDREDVDEQLLAHFDDTRRKFLDHAQKEVITPKIGRIAQRQRRCELLDKLMMERSEAFADAPGGSTGLVTRHPRSTKDDPVFVLDDRLLHEIRELENDIAREFGELNPKIDLDNIDAITLTRILEAQTASES